jgi:hypothetical protein
MRVRPFFWTLLAIACASVLVLAVVVTNNRVYPLQAQVAQVLTSPAGVAVVRLYLTDTEDQPVDQATILLNASMPEMHMEPQTAHLQALGQGGYLARFHLSMSGLWQLFFQVSAPGFLPTHQLLTLQVR